MVVALLVGLVLGFFGSVPVAGPVAVLVLARAVDGRARSALGIAGGAALAEAGYAFLAFWGFAALLARYPFVVPVARAAAAVLLVVLGVYLLRRGHGGPAPSRDRVEPAGDMGGGVALGFTVTALNPTLLATWTAAATVISSSGLLEARPALALPFAVGAAIGIVAWFAVLLRLVHRHRGRLSERALARLMRAGGALLVALGLWFAALFGRWLIEP